MTEANIDDNAPGTSLFPQFESEIYDMICAEIEGLTDEQLDFDSDKWGWSEWSIRRNLSHMSSGDFRWLLQRWGSKLFPDGMPHVRDFDGYLNSEFERRLDENKYWNVPDILNVLREGLDLSWSILSRETVTSMQSQEIETTFGGLTWIEVHPTGVRLNPDDSSKGYVTLEATFRHRYFEYTTHLYNIQRLKKAQGLAPVVEIPYVGYWSASGWDRSEP